MSMDIESRAKDFVTENGRFPFDEYSIRHAMSLIEFAEKEKEMWIERACEWLSCYGDDARWENPQDKIKEFRREMEEI